MIHNLFSLTDQGAFHISQFEFIGAIAGLVGGITGLVGFGFQVWFHFATGPRVKVNLMWAANMKNGTQLLNIVIVNSGRLAAKVESVSVEYSNTQHSPLKFFPDGTISGPQLPVAVESQSSVNWLIELETIKNAVQKIEADPVVRVRICLATGKIMRSKEIRLLTE